MCGEPEVAKVSVLNFMYLLRANLFSNLSEDIRGIEFREADLKSVAIYQLGFPSKIEMIESCMNILS